MKLPWVVRNLNTRRTNYKEKPPLRVNIRQFLSRKQGGATSLTRNFGDQFAKNINEVIAINTAMTPHAGMGISMPLSHRLILVKAAS
jgi:hypothetical protein